MKIFNNCVVSSLLCVLSMTADAATVVTNSFHGISFSISTTDNLVQYDGTNVIQCCIVNTSSERVYFSPWDPKVATQFYVVDGTGNEMRLTKDLSNSFRGGPTFVLGAKATNSYMFELPLTLTNMPESNTVFGEVTIYFDPKPSDRDSNGVVKIPAYNLRSNGLKMQ